MSDGEYGEGSVYGYMAKAPGAPKRLIHILGLERYNAWLAALPEDKKRTDLGVWSAAMDKLEELGVSMEEGDE